MSSPQRLTGARKLLLSGLGAGYMPFASGTWGSMGPCAVFLLAMLLPGGTLTAGIIMGGLLVVFSAACAAWGRLAEEHWREKDPGFVTADEWAGQALTLIALPIGAHWWSTWATVGAGFLAFRFFDIIKPPPARQLEHIGGGWGILLDDLMAGIYANLACQLLLRFLP